MSGSLGLPSSNQLAANRLTAVLFDIRTFARNLGAACIAMIKRYDAELVPDHI